MNRAWKHVTTSTLGILMALTIILGFASPASATAQTCISAPGGYHCTTVKGSGTYVASVYAVRGGVPGQVCNSSAWFFRVEPTGAVYDMGSQYSAGCNWVGRSYFKQEVHQSFPKDTLLCTKFYQDRWDYFIGEKCVGVS
jgi:hypothetical protein